jgi:hypothetical protein
MANQTCNYKECKNIGIHSMSNGEYHYCDEHYEGYIEGECTRCGMEIHTSWTICMRNCGLHCRPCSKTHDDEDCPDDEVSNVIDPFHEPPEITQDYVKYTLKDGHTSDDGVAFITDCYPDIPWRMNGKYFYVYVSIQDSEDEE